MKEGLNDNRDITGDSITAVSSDAQLLHSGDADCGPSDTLHSEVLSPLTSFGISRAGLSPVPAPMEGETFARGKHNIRKQY